MVKRLSTAGLLLMICVVSLNVSWSTKATPVYAETPTTGGPHRATGKLLASQPIELASSQDEETKKFMKVKLVHSQKLVEGLTTGDFGLLAKHSQELHVLSNESTWNVFQTEEYIRMSREFAESALRLRDAARDENLDGATLAYFEVTMNCVRCHKYTRNQQR